LRDYEKLYHPLQGKTYSLFADRNDPQIYFARIKLLADTFLELYPDERKLLDLVRRAGKNWFFAGLESNGDDRKTLRFIRKTLKQSLSIYTQNVSQHLKSLSLAGRLDATLATTEDKYHLYMLEIELVNRIYAEQFRRSEYKLALIAHCLRDFRDGCRSVKAISRPCARAATKTASSIRAVACSKDTASKRIFP